MTDMQPQTAELAAELARLLDVPSLDLDLSVAQLGWDSMMLVELAIAAEVVYERRMNLENLKIDFDMKLCEVLRLVDGLMRESSELSTLDDL